MNTEVSGSDLKRLRERLGLGQDAMAERLETSREWLSKLENGKREISPKIIVAYNRLMRESGFTQVEEVALGYVARDEEQTAYGRPASRTDVEAYMRERYSEAEGSRDPNAFPTMLHTLKRALPPGMFLLSEEERTAERRERREGLRQLSRTDSPKPGTAGQERRRKTGG